MWWGIVSVSIDVVCLVAGTICLVRAAAAHRRDGVSLFKAPNPLIGLPRGDRRILLREIRRREVPAERLELAREWARFQRRLQAVTWAWFWYGVMTATGVFANALNPDPLAAIAFWLTLVGLCMLTVVGVLSLRDHLAASRLLRDSSRPA